jgi:hypothetical protein
VPYGLKDKVPPRPSKERFWASTLVQGGVQRALSSPEQVAAARDLGDEERERRMSHTESVWTVALSGRGRTQRLCAVIAANSAFQPVSLSARTKAEVLNC